MGFKVFIALTTFSRNQFPLMLESLVRTDCLKDKIDYISIVYAVRVSPATMLSSSRGASTNSFYSQPERYLHTM